MRALLAALLILCAGSVWGQTASTNGGGLHFPDPTAGICTPLCVGIKATWIVPAASYDSGGGTISCSSPFAFTPCQGVYSWVGIDSGSSNLVQLGTASFTNSVGGQYYFAWYEAPPAALVATALVVSPGDNVTASMVCATNCTAGNVSATWNLLIVNNTTGLSFTLNGFAATAGLSYARVKDEFVGSSTANFGVHRFSDIQINQGSGYVQLTSLTKPSNQVIYENLGTRWSVGSAMNAAGEFNICFSNTQANGTYPPPACGIGPYSGPAAVGLGP